MSGYGGQGWQNPYDQGPAGSPYGNHGWQDPYAAGQGYGPPVPPANQGAVVGALICNILATLLCCLGFSIGGIVTSAIALSRTQTDPESARNLTRWSWGLFITNVVLAVIGIIIYIVVIFAVAGSTPDSGYGGSYD